MRKLVVSHDVDNRSDHDPVLMHLAIDYARIVTGSRLFTPKLAWPKASERGYTDVCGISYGFILTKFQYLTRLLCVMILQAAIQVTVKR
jgi:hypothetical protein